MAQSASAGSCLGQVPGLRRREDPLPHTPYCPRCVPVDLRPVQKLVLRSVHHPPHRRCRARMASNWSVGSSVVVNAPPQAHPTPSAPFRVRAPRPGIRPVMRTSTGSRPPCPGFPLPFGHRHSLLGHPSPAEEFNLPRSRPTRPGGPDLDGISLSARARCDRIGRPLPPRTAVLSWPHRPLGQRLPLLNGQSCSPRYYIHLRGSTMTRRRRGSLTFARPIFPSPVVLGWNENLLGLNLGLRTHGYPRRTPRRDRPSSTDPGSPIDTSRPPLLST